MAVEIEAKMKLADLAPLRQRLQHSGAGQIGSALEVNILFDNPDQRLFAADCGLRLRQTLSLVDARQTITMTFKGPQHAGQLKSRQEIEIGVSDFAPAEAMLTALGFAPVLKFEKRRESWELDNCRVDLDELPFLGTFVEIEGPDATSVMRVRQALGLADLPLIKTSYIAMLMAHLQEHGISDRVVLFHRSAGGTGLG